MKLSTDKQIRVDAILKYMNGDLYLEDALAIVRLKERQFRRLIKAFKERGFESLAHGNTHRSPPNKTSEPLRLMIVREYQSKYFDHNISHFREKLLLDQSLMEKYGTIPSYQTIRRILLKENLISRRVQRRKKAYKPRKRYEREGLMVQIDGSHHHWILGHAPVCLTAAIDDASGKLLSAKFTPTETTFAAMDVVHNIVKNHGSFQMLYSDKAGIYGGGKRQGYSNMDRAMKELGIIPVQANSPQAKGRVERLFKTLQDRLISDMRLAGIASIKEANDYLQNTYIESFNKRFSKEVAESAYRPLRADIDLREVFTMREHRTVNNGNLFSYKSKRYVLDSNECLARRPIELRFYPDGEMRAFIANEQVKITAEEKMSEVA